MMLRAPSSYDAVSEKAWSQTLCDALQVLGWLPYRTWTSIRSPAGYPDITAVHIGQKRCIWIEAKTERGKLRPRQEIWRDTLLAAGCEWFLLRPSDWPTAERVMRGERLVTEPKESS